MDLLEMHYSGILTHWKKSGLANHVGAGAPHIILHYNGEIKQASLYHGGYCERLEFSLSGELMRFCSRDYVLMFDKGRLTGAGQSIPSLLNGHLLHGEFKDFRYTSRGYYLNWYRNGEDITDQVEEQLTVGQVFTEEDRAKILAKCGI